MRYLPFAVLAVAMIYTLVDCVRADGGHVRALPKTAWFVVILVLPVIGIVLWFLFGRPQSVAATSAPAPRPLSPDDDPRFLSDLAEQRRRERVAERRREAERAARDARQSLDRPAEGGSPTESGPTASRPDEIPPTEPRRGEQPDRNGRNPAQGSAGPEDAPGT